MKKTALALTFILALLVSTMFGVHFGSAQSGTNVSGIISSDITWTQANSPYNLTGNVLVNNGVTLTIEPSVTANLNNYYIMVNGTLQAIGDGANSITFNGGQITFTQYSTNWNESTGTGCIIQNAIISSAMTLGNLITEISDDTIYGAINTGAQSIISNNTITGGISVSEGEMPTISNNTILGPGISLFLANATVSDNTILGSGITAYTDFSGYGWFNCTSLIEGNLIANGRGIEVREQQGSAPNSPIILNNTITNNTIGIYVTWIGISPPQPEILNNNIYGNSNYNIELNVPNSINATYNWWGTTNTTTISESIYDFYDDFNLGKADFDPFLTEPNPAAPVIPTFTILASAGAGGSINPSGSVSVNYGDNQTFIITANTDYCILDVAVDGSSVGAVSSYTFTNVQVAHTISATFEPKPVIPEFPSILILPLFMIATLVGVIFNKEKHLIKRAPTIFNTSHTIALCHY
jgi:hypothetical protein